MDGIPYLREKRLSNGKIGYYFEIPKHKQISGYKENSKSLGNDPFIAKQEALRLYYNFKNFKKRENSENPKTISYIWNIYIKHRKYTTKADRTKKDYCSCHDKICKFSNDDGIMLKDIPLDLFDNDSAYDLYLSLKESYKERAAKYCISLLSIIFNFGITNAKVFEKNTLNPFEELGITSSQPQNKYIYQEDVSRLIQKSKEMRKQIVALAIELNYIICQRPADLLSLRKSNFYFKDKDCFVEIWQQKSRGKQKAISYIPPHLAIEISKCTDYLFVNKNGNPYSVNSFGKEFKKIKDALNLDCEFRLLRHSGGTAYVEAGVETNTITIMTGHKDEKVFNQNYKGKSEIAAKNAYLKRENNEKNHSD